jgi:hypothetical protein
MVEILLAKDHQFKPGIEPVKLGITLHLTSSGGFGYNTSFDTAERVIRQVCGECKVRKSEYQPTIKGVNPLGSQFTPCCALCLRIICESIQDNCPLKGGFIPAEEFV